MINIAKLKPFDKIEIIRQCTGLSSTQKLILLVLASHLGKNEFCFLSLSTLQKECCLAKRNAVADNIKALINANIVWKISPSSGFKSNRYGINFNLLVTNGYQCGNPRLLDQSPKVTRLVTDGYPKRNINKVKEIKEASFSVLEQKAKNIEAIAKIKSGLRK